MRELKFRIWDIEDNKNEMIFFSIIEAIFRTYPDPFVTSRNAIIMQYTGLKDEKGKDIYEGDLLAFDETPIGGKKGVGEVIYDTDMTLYGPCFCLWVVPNRGLMLFPFGGEVIGNIYENPELLL